MGFYSMQAKPSLCIIAHFAYGAMLGGRTGHIGGVEWQTSLTAKWFAARGYPVSLIVWDEGGPREEAIDGVRVIKMCRFTEGVRGLRFFHPRWTSLNRALRRANAEVYYHNCAEHVTGQIALWCRLHRRSFVFSSANDTDCDRSLPELKTTYERVFCRYGLRHAHRIIVQTEHQRERLLEGSGLDSECIPMPCPAPANDAWSRPEVPARRVLWAARIASQKRPDRLLDLARECPDLQFELVGPAYEGDYSRKLLDQAKTLPNVTVQGPIPRDRMPSFYQRAGCLCCTSDYEGFPNTFLEAWSHGLPIVTTVDPDGVVGKHRLGLVAHSVPELGAALYRLLNSPQDYLAMSRNAREYFTRNHSAEVVLARFERVFLAAATEARSAAVGARS